MPNQMPSSRKNRVLHGLGFVNVWHLAVFTPTVCLLGFWLLGDAALIMLMLIVPVFVWVLACASQPQNHVSRAITSVDTATDRLDAFFSDPSLKYLHTACVVVQFDDLNTIMRRHGRAAQAEVWARSIDRMRGTLRLDDSVVQLQGNSVAIVLAPVSRLDLETLVQLAGRIQMALIEPVAVGGVNLYVTASIGFCASGRNDIKTGQALLEAAELAADEASRNGPGAIRAYCDDMIERISERDTLRADLESALQNGEITAYFQPQICTDTGELSGFEALSRWQHPTRGCLLPGDFLEAIERNDLCERLSEVMVQNALAALATWQKAGLSVPNVAVNFSAAELRNPRLLDRIKWELARYNIAPQGLTIEILETVVVNTDHDVVVSNVAALSELGCGIDLDDFGTGHASIATIRRFAVKRVKIDRSFVKGVDQDREQQRMVAAIVSFADRLGLSTLAEGVESSGEHAMLSQLGCVHVQGFGLGEPMPLHEASEWARKHQNRPDRLPKIGFIRR